MGGRLWRAGRRDRATAHLSDLLKIRSRRIQPLQHRDAQGRHGTRLHQQDLQEAAAHHEAVEAVEDGHEVLAQAQPIHLHQHLHGEQRQQHQLATSAGPARASSAPLLRITWAEPPVTPHCQRHKGLERGTLPAFQDILLSLRSRSSKTTLNFPH